MSAMHPEFGVPPEDARNSLPNEVEASVNCQELWYSTSRCQPRFDPAAANAMLAELITLINKGEVVYDCLHLDQVQYAVRYLIQRGLCQSGLAFAGPNAFLLTLDPILTRYNDHLTLIVVPEQNNAGAVTINVNGRGVVPVVRNDGQQLEKNDWLKGIPVLISYWIDRFYMVGLVASQIPCVITGTLDVWIRTDGDDNTGDGTENTPQKAYRTIQRAWNDTGARCASSATGTINLRLGIPGTYAGASLGPYGATVNLFGDPDNPAGYRINAQDDNGTPRRGAMYLSSVNRASLIGLTLVQNINPGWYTANVYSDESYTNIVKCNLEVILATTEHYFIIVIGGAAQGQGTVSCNAFGNNVHGLMMVSEGASWQGSGGSCSFQANNMNFIAAGLLAGLVSTIRWTNVSISSNATGPEYNCSSNSVVTASGQNLPGNQPGSVSTGGQFIP